MSVLLCMSRKVLATKDLVFKRVYWLMSFLWTTSTHYIHVLIFILLYNTSPNNWLRKIVPCVTKDGESGRKSDETLYKSAYSFSLYWGPFPSCTQISWTQHLPHSTPACMNQKGLCVQDYWKPTIFYAFVLVQTISKIFLTFWFSQFCPCGAFCSHMRTYLGF